MLFTLYHEQQIKCILCSCTELTGVCGSGLDSSSQVRHTGPQHDSHLQAGHTQSLEYKSLLCCCLCRKFTSFWDIVYDSSSTIQCRLKPNEDLAFKKVELLIQLQEFEGTSRSPALLLRQPVVYISLVFRGTPHFTFTHLFCNRQMMIQFY